MSYQVILPGQGIARPGLGRGGKGRVKLYGKQQGRRRGYTSRFMSRVGMKYGRGYTRTGGFYGRFSQDGELKFLDTSIAISPVPATGDINPTTFLVVPQDDTQSGRNGRKIVVKSIHLKMIALLGQGTVSAECLRYIVYLDRQCNGAAAGVTDILSVANFDSFNNLANTSRFTILCDKFIELNSQTGIVGAFGEYVAFINWNKKVNIPIEYDSSAATGALTTIRSNNIGLLTISTSGDIAVDGRCRVRYVG